MMKYYELLREAEQAMSEQAKRLVNASYTALPEKYSDQLDEALRLIGLGRQQLRVLASALEQSDEHE